MSDTLPFPLPFPLYRADRQGLKPGQPATPFDAFTAELAHALHLYLARSPTALVALQIEDLLGETLPVNVPGTDKEYPNWQRKISADIEDIAGRADLAAHLDEIRATRDSVAT